MRVGRATFGKGGGGGHERTRTSESLGNFAEHMARLPPRFSRHGWIERRGLLHPGRFKLQAQTASDPSIEAGEGERKTITVKRSVLKKRPEGGSEEDGFRRMKEVCRRFNIQRKEAYNIRSEFFSLLRMFET